MDNLFSITLEAHNPERNHHRQYEMTIGRDLFGEWTLTIRFGRVGTYGTVQQFASHDLGELRAIVRERLARRRTSQSRIGCVYR